MKNEKLYQVYKTIMIDYLTNPAEDILYRASLMGRDFIEKDLGPDQMIQMHFNVLSGLLDEYDCKAHKEITFKLYVILLEAMMVYSDTHKKIRDVLSELRIKYSELDDAKKEIEMATEQLIQAEKLSAVGQLAAGVAHEINNPLTAVRMNATFLEEAVIGDEKQTKQVRTIIKETDRAAKIVGNLLAFSRRSSMDEKELTDVNVVIEDTLKPLEHQLELVGIKINRKFGKDLPEVKINANRIHQVFLNLITNARDAINNNGEITISSVLNNGSVEAEFRDTGCGISEKERVKIFDPFFTTKTVGKGTGLGLSVSYQIVKDHGGKIEVDSAPGKGTVFTVRLPVG